MQKIIDCQIPTPHLESLGAKIMYRRDFLELVKESTENCKDF
jgi:leucyl/phenylalanyl-tRNA--protein transferase